MRRAFQTSVVVTSTFVLTSCTPPAIKVTANRVNGRQIITLTQDWGVIFHDKKAPCVDRVDLSESGPKGKPIWRFEAKASECIDLASFTVGVVPSGFVERIALAPATRGRFDLLIIGLGIGEAQIALP